jgi:hypothetical protein
MSAPDPAPLAPVSTELILLRDIACSRSGDKGNVVNVCVIPYDRDAHWDLLRERLTSEVVAERFAGLVSPGSSVTRYEMPGIAALNFVIDGALAGGVSASLRVDGHGKTFQSLLLDTTI